MKYYAEEGELEVYPLREFEELLLDKDYNLKEITLLEAKAYKLKSAKTRLIEKIDQFLIDSVIWEEIKRGYPELKIKLLPDEREKFIVKNFHLDRFFKIIDDRIEKINNRIKFLEIYSRIPGKKLRITPRNLVILIWSKVMEKRKKEGDIDFENISLLLNWLSLNKNWASMFKSIRLVSSKTPELTYNRYIKFAKDEGYHDISNFFYVTCFPDIAKSLTHMFPNPLDLVNYELEGKKIMAKNEFEKAIKKPVF